MTSINLQPSIALTIRPNTLAPSGNETNLRGLSFLLLPQDQTMMVQHHEKEELILFREKEVNFFN